MSNEKVKPSLTANHSLSLKRLGMNNSTIRVEFKGSYLKQDKVTFNPYNMVNLFVIYEVNRWSANLNADFTLKIVCLELVS